MGRRHLWNLFHDCDKEVRAMIFAQTSTTVMTVDPELVLTFYLVVQILFKSFGWWAIMLTTRLVSGVGN